MLDPKDTARDPLFISALTRDADVVAKNIATNARLVCALLVIICLAIFLRDGPVSFAILAVQPVGAIALSIAVDRLPPGRWRSYLATVAYAIPVFVAVAIILKLR